MISLFTGRRFCAEVARTLGVEPKLLGSALLEVGVTWAHFKTLKRANYSAEEALEVLLPQFANGLAVVKARFGDQPEILEAEQAIENRTAMKAPITEGDTAHEPEECDGSGEQIISSEFPEGRYELAYNLQSAECVRGRSIGNNVQYVLRSDDLETLYNIGLAKQIGGASVKLTDSETDHHVPLSFENLPEQ